MVDASADERFNTADGIMGSGSALQSDLDAFAAGVPFGDDRTFVLLRRVP